MDKMQVAIIGCGVIANAAHGPSYSRNDKVHIAYCVDIIPERARKLAEKYGDADTKAITDYREMLKDESVKAVSVCVPNYLHAPISIDCLNAGKHVLCEKPAARTYPEALTMQDAAIKAGRILNIGVVNRFNTAVMRVRDIVASGALGEVYHVYCSFRAHRSIPGLGGPFTTKEMAGGGVLIDWGVHYLDLINYILGGPKLRSVSSAAYSKLGRDMRGYTFIDMWAGPPDYEGTYDVEDFVTGFVRTQGGPSLTLNGAWAQNVFDAQGFIEFLGDKAGIKLNYGGDFTLYQAKDGALQETTPKFKKADMFYDELDAFIDSAASGVKNRGNIDEVLITAQLMDALYESASTGKEITFA